MGLADDYEKALEKEDERLSIYAGSEKQVDRFSNTPTDRTFLNRLNEQRLTREQDEARTRSRMASESAKWIQEENEREKKRHMELKRLLEMKSSLGISAGTNIEWITAERARQLINEGAKTYPTVKSGTFRLVTGDGKLFMYRIKVGTGKRNAKPVRKNKKVRYSWAKVDQ